MKRNNIILIAVVVLLVLVDLLTFHDIFEVHTLKDWMILAASVLSFIYLAKVSLVKIR